MLEHDEADTKWPAVADPIREAITMVLLAIIEATTDGSSEREKALREALAAAERIRAAFVPSPRLN
jgi:hypothetical protein